MKFDEVVRGRRSIRGFLDKPVPKALIREILELAMRAPTSLNTQPRNFYVVTGAVLDRIRQGNVECNLAGVPDSREFRMGPDYQGTHRERQIGIAKQLFAAMGIERDIGNATEAGLPSRPANAPHCLSKAKTSWIHPLSRWVSCRITW